MRPPRAPLSVTTAVLPGRRAEIQLIERELHLARNGEGRVVVLVGEAGVGKTRLLHEVGRHAGMLALGVRTLPEHLGPDDLLGQWLSPLLVGSLPMASRRDLVLAARIYPHLAELDPIAASQHSQVGSISGERARAAAARLIAEAAEHRPLLFLLDDLPRFRPETQELIVYLAAGLTDACVAFLASARLEGRSDPLGNRTFAPLLDHHLLRRIEIRPLDREGLAELVAGELDPEIVSSILPWLFERSCGNAFFAIELLRSLQARGILRFDTERDRWHIHGHLSELPLPQTIGHVLEARCRSLPPHIARFLPALAFLGPDAPIPLLAASLETGEAPVEGLLSELVDAGVLNRCGGLHAFAHPLMIEHWSTVLSINTRHQIAQNAVNYLLGEISLRDGSKPSFTSGSCATGLEAAKSDEIARLLAYADAAGQPEVFALAAIESGRRSLAGSRVREAASWTRRAGRRQRHVENPEVRRWLTVQLDDLMGRTLYFAGRFGAAERRLERFIRAPEGLDPKHAPSAFTYLGLLRQKSHRHEEAKLAFLAGLEAFGGAEPGSPRDLAVRAGFLNHLSWNELQRGEVDEAERIVEQTARLLGDEPPPEAARAVTQLLHSQSSISAARGDFRQSIAARERVLELSRQHVPTAIAKASTNLARMLAMTGDLERARRLIAEAIHVHTEVEDRASLSTSWLCRGLIEDVAAEWDASRQAFERARRFAELTAHQINRFGAMLGLMTCHEAVGDQDASNQAWIEALTTQRADPRLPIGLQFELHFARVSALCRRRDWEGALDVAASLPRPLRPDNPPRDLAALEILIVRAEVGRMSREGALIGKSIEGSPASSGEASSLQEQIEQLAARLDAHEGYLREQNLRGDLVDLARVRLHLHLAGWRNAYAEVLLAEIEEHVMIMHAKARLAEIAEEFLGTAIADLPNYRRVFLPARTRAAEEKSVRARESNSNEVEPIPLGSLASQTCSVRTEGSGHLGATVFLPGQNGAKDRLRIHAFGHLRVIRAGEESPIRRQVWGSRKARVLLAYFLAEDPSGKGLSRSALCDVIWPDTDSLNLENRFHVTLARLRRALGPCIAEPGKSAPGSCLRHEDGRYSLDFGALWCDACEFEEDLHHAAKVERSGQWEEAANFRRRAFELYDGEFLADFDEGWAESRREHYRTEFLQLGFALAQEALKECRFDEAQDIAERLVSAEPLAEEAHRLLIRVHKSAGRRDAAARQLDRCRSILAAELGLEVSEETRRILESP
jgi:two-component SAPR family response regulator